MACAAFAAESGAKVLVVEKQAVVGGSSNYSAGMLYVSRRRQVQRILLTTSSWAPKNYNSLRSWVPDGDPELQAAWMKDYLPAVQWMRENGIPTAKRFDGIMTIGIDYIQITIHRRLFTSELTKKQASAFPSRSLSSTYTTNNAYGIAQDPRSSPIPPSSNSFKSSLVFPVLLSSARSFDVGQ